MTWLGTCANCQPGERKIDQYTCSGSGQTRLNALVAEPVEEASSAAKQEKGFPTVVVAGLGVLIMVLSAVTGMVCMRGREKTNTQAAVQEEQVAEAQSQVPESIEAMVEEAPKGTDESSSAGKNSEWALKEADGLTIQPQSIRSCLSLTRLILGRVNYYISRWKTIWTIHVSLSKYIYITMINIIDP